MYTSVIAAIALALSPGLCHAASAYIYQWQDEEGHTHMGDSVPQRYRDVATRIDARQFALPESQRAEAAARRAKEKKRMADREAQRARARAAQPYPHYYPYYPSFASGPGWLAPYPWFARPVVQLGEECDRLWWAYFNSQECFAPYRTRYGIKADAFQHCTPVLDPSPMCGVPNPFNPFRDG